MLTHGPAIEAESFRIIDETLNRRSFTPQEQAIVRRIVHATADFDFAENTVFHPRAIASGIAALKSGCTIVTDVNMLRSGIIQRFIDPFGAKTACHISDPDLPEKATQEGTTKAVQAMRKARSEMEGGIVIVGNAPTALYEVIRMIHEEGLRPGLVIGVPVGFVSAEESKEELMTLGIDTPFIVCRGKKGGSSVGASAMNALSLLAKEAS